MIIENRYYQQNAIDKGVDCLQHNKPPGLLVLPTACHAKGTGVILSTGEIKSVEDIRVGDRLISPTSGEYRTVLQLHKGVDKMYRITPKRGSSFIVNENHILHLVSTNISNVKKSPSCKKGGSTVDITLKDYLNKSKTFKHTHKLLKVGVIEFERPSCNLPIPPWEMGLLIGDGSFCNTSINFTTMDDEVVNKMAVYASTINRTLTKQIKIKNGVSNKASTYILKKGNNPNIESIQSKLSKLELLHKKAGDKFVPVIYKYGSVETRYQLLAGLLDSDGYHDGRGGYDFISKSKQLSEDLVFICNSLGINARMNKSYKYCQTGAGGLYWRVSISGNTEPIPCIIPRNIPSKRKMNKNPLRHGFDVEYIGDGEYYGFTLDGDHLYCTDDFIIHHNSGKSLVVGNIANSVKGSTLVLQPSKEILEQNYSKIMMLNPDIDAAMYSASVGRKDIGKITFSTIGSIYKKPELFSHFDNVIIDEAHCVNPKEGMYKSFFNAIGNKPKIGLTATPYRTYRNRFGSQMRVLCRTRDRVFSDIIHTTQIDEMLGNNPTSRHYLAQLKYYDLSKDVNFDSGFLRSNSSGGEFTQESIDYHMEHIGFYNSILGIIERVIKAGRKKILIFTESIAKSEEICKSLGLMGYTAATVSAYTPKKERAAILKKFAEGLIHILVNVQALTTGVDIPGIDCIIDGNPTKSLQLYLQKIGRGARIDPSGVKTDCWVVDLVENFMRFGRMDQIYIEHSGAKAANAWNIIRRQKGKRDIIINDLYM